MASPTVVFRPSDKLTVIGDAWPKWSFPEGWRINHMQ